MLGPIPRHQQESWTAAALFGGGHELCFNSPAAPCCRVGGPLLSLLLPAWWQKKNFMFSDLNSINWILKVPLESDLIVTGITLFLILRSTTCLFQEVCSPAMFPHVFDVFSLHVLAHNDFFFPYLLWYIFSSLMHYSQFFFYSNYWASFGAQGTYYIKLTSLLKFYMEVSLLN